MKRFWRDACNVQTISYGRRVADLCLEEEDPDYMEVLHKVWRSLVDKKLYITGGCGALYNGASPYGYFFDHQLVHQAYGYEYQLPNITAYNETCASLGGVFWGVSACSSWNQRQSTSTFWNE